MTAHFAEILITIISTLYTGFLFFIAGVLQSVMNALKESEFRTFLNLLTAHAMKSPYAIAVSTVPFVAAFPYFYYYGFGNRWFVAGLIVFTLASVISKSLNLPIYKKVLGLSDTDTSPLREQRSKLQTANIVRAVIQLLSLVLMVVGLA